MPLGKPCYFLVGGGGGGEGRGRSVASALSNKTVLPLKNSASSFHHVAK